MGGSYFIIILYFISVYFAIKIIRGSSGIIGKNKVLLNYIILSVNIIITPLGYIVFYLNTSNENKLTMLYGIAIILIAIFLYHLIVLLYIFVRSLIKYRDEIEMKPYIVFIKLCFINHAISLVNAFFIVMLMWGVG